MTTFRFLLMTLSAYRVTRFFTSDVWPPIVSVRHWIESHSSYFGEMFTCPWCIGTFVTVGLFAVDEYLFHVPVLALFILAAMTIVGFLGNYDD